MSVERTLHRKKGRLQTKNGRQGRKEITECAGHDGKELNSGKVSLTFYFIQKVSKIKGNPPKEKASTQFCIATEKDLFSVHVLKYRRIFRNNLNFD